MVSAGTGDRIERLLPHRHSTGTHRHLVEVVHEIDEGPGTKLCSGDLQRRWQPIESPAHLFHRTIAVRAAASRAAVGAATATDGAGCLDHAGELPELVAATRAGISLRRAGGGARVRAHAAGLEMSRLRGRQRVVVGPRSALVSGTVPAMGQLTACTSPTSRNAIGSSPHP